MAVESIDLALRAGTVALLLLLAAVLLRDFGRAAAGRCGAAFALGSAAFALSSAPGFSPQASLWHSGLIALSTGNVVLFWLFTRTLFDDAFKPRRWHAAAWAVLAAASLVNCLLLVPSRAVAAQAFGLGLNTAALAVIVLALAQTMASWSADLVEGRRRMRLFIVGAAAIYGAVNAGWQIVLPASAPAMAAGLVNAGILAAIVVAIAWSLVRLDGSELFATIGRAESSIAAPPDRASLAADQRLRTALDQLMTQERIYRREGLTIGTMAAQLAVPEYKLRRMINRDLGYRNFNVFLNDYRIREVKAALADPAQAAVPVLTIALDAGFQSLGPFNRAFKAETGTTPTEYRRAGLAATI